MKRPLFPLAFAALSLSAFAPAHAATAEVLDGKPASLIKVLGDEGYKPELRPGDAKTQPSIMLKVSGDNVYLYFSGCADGACRRVTASNGFEYPKDRSGLAAMLAAWNAEWYSQAYEDQDGVYLDASYLLTGGYTRANFLAWFSSYLNDMHEFQNKLY